MQQLKGGRAGAFTAEGRQQRSSSAGRQHATRPPPRCAYHGMGIAGRRNPRSRKCFLARHACRHVFCGPARRRGTDCAGTGRAPNAVERLCSRGSAGTMAIVFRRVWRQRCLTENCAAVFCRFSAPPRNTPHGGNGAIEGGTGRGKRDISRKRSAFGATWHGSACVCAIRRTGPMKPYMEPICF